jgi:hypothetical protein
MFSPRLVAKTYTQTLPACGSLPSLAGEFMAKREPTGIKGSQNQQSDGSQVLESLIGGDAVRTLQKLL